MRLFHRSSCFRSEEGIMEKYNVYAARLLPKDDYVSQGHRACQGCAEALAMRLVQKELGRTLDIEIVKNELKSVILEKFSKA